MSSRDDSLRVWVSISRIQFWLVLACVLFSIAVIIKALQKLLTLKRSPFYIFLLSIVVADLISLATLLFDIVSQSLFISIKGPLLCKSLVFVSNAAACFANWIWLVMFLQRCVLLLLPLARGKEGLIGFLHSSKKLIIATFITASITQSWSLFLLTERQHLTSEGQVATTCERDTELLSASGYKWVALLEALSTYVVPFLATLVLDLGVLVWHRNSTKFAVTSADSVRNSSANRLKPRDGLKILSSQSIKSCSKRRQRAIRRCLIMATVQVLLNAPYYLLQLLDEVYLLQSSSDTLVLFVCCDALLYLIYLCQFPMISVYISAMRKESNRNRSAPTSPFSSSMRYTNESGLRSPRPSKKRGDPSACSF